MTMEKIVSLCKSRGFLFQSSEIYGGLNGFWDYGPLGVELKRNVKEAWWRDMVSCHDDMNTLPGARCDWIVSCFDGRAYLSRFGRRCCRYCCLY